MSDLTVWVISFLGDHHTTDITESHHRDIMCVCLYRCAKVLNSNCQSIKWEAHRQVDIHDNTLQTLKSEKAFIDVLTFEFVVLRVSREKAVGEELGKGEACVLWPVLDIVPHCGLKLLHELW